MLRRRIYYTVRGEQLALRPYRYATETDGRQYWTFYAKNRRAADVMAAKWARKSGHDRIYRIRRKK